MIRFGPSGNSESFYEQGFKSSVQMPKWLKDMGLSAYEYQCNKGVRIGKELAQKIGEEAREHNIALSIHAPYFISMASPDPVKRQNSKRYVLESLQAAKWMGATRVVVHTGACSKMSREEAMALCLPLFRETIAEADDAGLGDITICPELLGKTNQLGSLEEVLEMSRLDERIIPCIDFGHLHARGLGALNTVSDFENAILQMEHVLGKDRLQRLHIHFSRIEFTKGGEKKHWTLDDTQYGPEFEHLAEVLVKKQMQPTIICESRECMAEDSLKLKQIYEVVAGRV